jgi:DNA-binding LytR/AlgR family response regulator
MHEPPASIREGTAAAARASWTAAYGECLSQMRRDGALARSFAIATVAGLFLAFIGPFGTVTGTLVQRIVFWMVLVEGGTALGVGVSAATLVSTDRLRDRPYRVAVVAALAMTLPFTGAVLAMAAWVFPERHIGWLNVALPALLLCLVMNGVNALAHRQPAETHARMAQAGPVRFLERLPPRLRGADLHAVEAEDHYLRLHTSKGQDLILLRLADAIAELDGIEGARTHRSWWVAKAAVTGVRRGDGRATLTLASGAEAPVSRSYARALREAGWF